MQRTVEQLRHDCVEAFDCSTQRPLIMEGVSTCHDQIKGASLTGDMWVGGEFVTADPEPASAMVLLKVPASVHVTGRQTSTMEWLRGEHANAEYFCETYCLHEVLPTDECYDLYRETEAAIREEFSMHQDGSLRGYAVISI